MARFRKQWIRAALVLGMIFGVEGFAGIGLAGTEASSLGEVTSIQGRVYRILPDGSRQMLACGRSVGAGDPMIAGEWGHVAISTGEVYAQIQNLSDFRVQRGDDGSVQFRLIGGGLRILDAREDRTGSVRIVTEFAEAVGSAQDVEVFVEEGKRLVMCAEIGDLEVSVRGGAAQRIETGQCATLQKRDKALQITKRSQPVIALDEQAICSTGTIIGSADTRFLPSDVAAPPPPRSFPNVVVGGRNPNRCDDPGRCEAKASSPFNPTIGNTDPTRGSLPDLPAPGSLPQLPTGGSLP